MSAVRDRVRIRFDELQEGGGEFALGDVLLGDHAVDGSVLRGLEALERSGRECLLAPDTAVLVSRRLLVAAGARERCEFVRLLVVDVEAVHGSVGEFVRLVAEPGHVAGGVLAASGTSLSILDSGLTHSLLDEPARVRLAEVRRRDWLRDTGAFGGQLEHVEIGNVRLLLSRGQFTPEWVAIVARGMVIEPGLEVGRRDDEVDGSAASLALDLDTHRVLGVVDVADLERLELTATEASLELDGDRRRVSSVSTAIDHRQDVVLPLEHVLLGWHRIVVSRGAGRNPGDRVGNLVHPECALSEDADGRSIVSVRLLVVVLAIDPPEDLLGGLAVLEGVGETTSRLGHSRTVAKELQMSVIGVLRVQQVQLVAETQQRITVSSSQFAVVVFDSLSQPIKFYTGIAHTKSLQPKTVNIVYTSRPWLLTNYLQSHAPERADCQSDAGGWSSFRQSTAFDKANNGLWSVDAAQSRCSA